MDYFLHTEPCPKCRSQGKDKSGDNMGIYSDGHGYCFNCGYYRPSPNALYNKLHSNNQPVLKHKALLPSDCDTTYSNTAIQWVEQYDLSREALLRNNALWSDEKQLLIFPVWGGHGELLAWQGRYFGNKKDFPKWYGRGQLNEVYNIMGKGKPLVLTEDIVSAIKVAMAGFKAMPLYGVNVKSRYAHLKLLDHLELILWLDPDMGIKMIKECKEGSLQGFKMRSVLTEKDPKEYSLTDIKNYLH